MEPVSYRENNILLENDGNLYQEAYNYAYKVYYSYLIDKVNNDFSIFEYINKLEKKEDKFTAIKASQDAIRDIFELRNTKDQGGFQYKKNHGYTLVWLLGLIGGVFSCALVMLYAFFK